MIKTSIKKIARIFLGKLFFRPYYALRTSWPVWFYLLNSEGRRFYSDQDKVLDAVEKRMADDLRRDGIAIVHIDEIFTDRRIFPILKKYTDMLLPRAHTMVEKDFNLEFWKETDALDFQNPFLGLALEEKVLRMAAAYLGVLPKLFYYSLWLTRPVPKDSPRVRSQNWHRDPDDKRMCKMFLYLNDIDEKRGPFNYIKGSQYGGRWAHIYPQRPPRGSYPPPGEVERLVSPEDIKACMGRAGTVIFADTAGLHRGGYAIEGERIMFTAEYSSKATFRPPRYRVPDNLDKITKDFPNLARYAMTHKKDLVRVLNRLSDFSRRYELY